MAVTPIQLITVPTGTDVPLIPAHLRTAIEMSETRFVMRFASATDRDAKIATPVAGMLCYLADTKLFYWYDTAWAIYGQATKKLDLLAVDGTHEGGEVSFIGSASYKTWLVDLYDNTMRFTYDSPVSFKQILTLTSSRAILGLNVILQTDGVDQPTIRTGNTTIPNATGKDGDVYFQWA